MKTDTITFYIKKFEKIKDSHEVIESLRVCNDLDIPEKNFIYLYLFPRPLLDMELPNRIMDQRGINNYSGYLYPELKEISLIVEAYKTQQYSRFIKHLLYSFTDPYNIHPVDGNGQCKCGLCGKNIYELKSWEEICNRFPEDYPEKQKKEFLCYGSSESNISLCLDCIIQLIEVKNILGKIEPGFLKIK